jgi:hypothetical protein
MTRGLLLPAGLVALATLAGSPRARADGPPNTSKHECVEANEAGQDLQQAGKLLGARAKLAVCVTSTCPGPVREDCAARLRDIDKAMPSILFEFTDANGNGVPGVAVTLDGARLADGVAGKPIEVDPGEHLFRFEATGRGPLEKKLTIREGEKNRQERIDFATSTPMIIVSPRQEPSTGPSSNAGSTAGGGTMRLLALVAGGAGVVGLGVGIGAGLAATSKHSTLQGECMDSVCPPTAKAEGDLDSFHSLRTVSAVGYAVGALGLIGGGVLFFVAPTRKRATTAAVVAPWLGLGTAGVRGAF